MSTLTDKFREMIVGINSMENRHKKWGWKPYLEEENRKNSYEGYDVERNKKCQ